MQKQEEKTGKTCGMEPRAPRLPPYIALRIETLIVEIEGGIASRSARATGDPNSQFNIEDYDNPNEYQTAGDIDFL